MADPFQPYAELQKAFLEAVLSCTQQSVQMWQHALELQNRFMNQACRHQRDHIEIATGPSLLDKYGKRAHDIDPERAV